jgi:hypothetical protein
MSASSSAGTSAKWARRATDARSRQRCWPACGQQRLMRQVDGAGYARPSCGTARPSGRRRTLKTNAGVSGAFVPEQRDDLTYVEKGGWRMVALINQWLDLPRLEAGRLELVLQPVDLAGILEAVRQDVTPQANRKGLELHIALPDALLPVMGDEERVRQILLNLVSKPSNSRSRVWQISPPRRPMRRLWWCASVTPDWGLPLRPCHGFSRHFARLTPSWRAGTAVPVWAWPLPGSWLA